MESLYREKLDSLAREHSKDDLLKHKRVTAFMETVWRQHFGEEEEDSGREPQTEEDLEIQMTQSSDTHRFLCPITKVILLKYF